MAEDRIAFIWTSPGVVDSLIFPEKVESGFWDPVAERTHEMPKRYSPEVCRQVIELARGGTKVKHLADAFQVSQQAIYSWLRQDRIDRGEAEGATTGQQLELAAARRRIRQLETELAVARKVNEVFLAEGVSPKGSSR